MFLTKTPRKHLPKERENQQLKDNCCWDDLVDSRTKKLRNRTQQTNQRTYPLNNWMLRPRSPCLRNLLSNRHLRWIFVHIPISHILQEEQRNERFQSPMTKAMTQSDQHTEPRNIPSRPRHKSWIYLNRDNLIEELGAVVSLSLVRTQHHI